MGSIPLPALDVHPPVQPDPLGQFQKLVALRSLQNQQQLQQQEIQQNQQKITDTQAVRQYMAQNPQSTLGDAANALKGKISLPAYTNLIDTDATIQQKHATATDAQLKNQEAMHNAQQRIYNNVSNLSDEQLAKQWPQIAQEFNSIPGNNFQVDPTQPLNKDQLQQHGVALGLQEAYLKQEQDKRSEQAKTLESQAKAESEQATAAKERQIAKWYADNPSAGAPGVPAETVDMIDWLRKNPGKTPADYPAAKAAAVSQAEAPVRIATAQAEGIARANIEAQVARGSNAAVATVPSHLVAPATAAATKAGEDYAQAQSVSQRLQAMMQAARQGNVVSYQLLPQEGALQITTSQGVHRINMAEIQNYGGGSLWQRLEGHIGKQLTGQSIPASVLNDMEDMQKIQAEGSQKKYENTLNTINQTYGAQFKPVEMQPLERNVTTQSAQPETRTYQGHTYAKQPDGSWKLQ